MRLLLAACGLGLLLSGCASAPVTTADAGKNHDPNQVVCKYERVVGSQIPERVCLTRAQRKELEDKAKTLTDWAQEGESPAPPSPASAPG